jgi:D-alanyl-D-alanine carboxypeptidase
MANSFFFGAGNLLSTGGDLVRWATALHHGHVLSVASYIEMTTPVRDGYAYGLLIGSLRGHMRLDHFGSVPGFYSELEYFPGTDNIVDSELMTLAAEPSDSG